MNLAFDEAMAQSASAQQRIQPALRIWVNQRSVILGRFQETTAEVDLEACDLNNVKVARRFSGGGTVFHDEFTLNITIITNPFEGSSLLMFQEKNLNLVSKALSDLGVGLTVDPPNSLLVGGRKICGAAAAIGKHFALWHCSILVGTDLQLLELTLAPSKSQSVTRFVHSKWRPVTTVAEAMSSPVGVNEVANAVTEAVETKLGVKLQTDWPSSDELRSARTLLAQKYSSNDWNLKGTAPSAAASATGRFTLQ